MDYSVQKRPTDSPRPGSLCEAPSRSGSQLKSSLGGKTYDEQAAALRPVQMKAGAAVQLKPDETTPTQLGVEWLTGSGPQEHNFSDGDPFTEELKQHPRIQEIRGEVRTQLSENCGSCDATGQGRANRSLAGAAGVLTYIKDYAAIATFGLISSNMPGVYLGSWSGEWAASNVNCATGSAKITYHIRNASSAESGTRIPVIGYEAHRPTFQEQVREGSYEELPKAILEENPIGETMGDAKETLGLDGSRIDPLLGTDDRRAPLATTRQTISWSEEVSFTANHECGAAQNTAD